jgi:hypothetical protein
MRTACSSVAWVVGAGVAVITGRWVRATPGRRVTKVIRARVTVTAVGRSLFASGKFIADIKSAGIAVFTIHGGPGTSGCRDAAVGSTEISVAAIFVSALAYAVVTDIIGACVIVLAARRVDAAS